MPAIFPQGTCIAQLQAVSEVFSNELEGHASGALNYKQFQEDYGESDGLAGSEGCISHEFGGSSQHREPDADFSEYMDDFDTKYGVSDFGYDEHDFQIFPCMDVCMLHTPSRKDSFIPKADRTSRFSQTRSVAGCDRQVRSPLC